MKVNDKNPVVNDLELEHQMSRFIPNIGCETSNARAAGPFVFDFMRLRTKSAARFDNWSALRVFEWLL